MRDQSCRLGEDRLSRFLIHESPRNLISLNTPLRQLSAQMQQHSGVSEVDISPPEMQNLPTLHSEPKTDDAEQKKSSL